MNIQRPTSSQVKAFVYCLVAFDILNPEQLSVFIRKVIVDVQLYEKYFMLPFFYGTNDYKLLETLLKPSKLFAVATDGYPFMFAAKHFNN